MRATVHRTALVAALGAFSSVAFPRGQEPIFHAAAELVHLDVSVLDKDRRPVRGLTAADFTVLEDGKPQPIVAFADVDVPDPVVATAKWMRQVSSDVESNANVDAPEGRLFVILLDDAMIPTDTGAVVGAKKIARRIIDQMSPLDQAAVVFSFGSGGAQNFTRDRARLLAAVDSLKPGPASYTLGWVADGRSPMDPDAALRSSSLETLRNVAETLIAAPQRRKILIYVSPGITADVESAALPVNMTKSTRPPDMAIYEANAALVHSLPELFTRMQRANVTMYPVDPFGLGGFETFALAVARGIRIIRQADTTAGGSLPVDYNWLALGSAPRSEQLAHHFSTIGMDFLDTAALNTGGHAIVNTNDFDPGLDSVFRENGSYYLVGYAMPSKNTPGSLHRLSVKVNRPGVTVRTRTGYQVEKNDTKTVTSPLSGPIPDSRMNLRATAVPVAADGPSGSAVALVIGFHEPGSSARTPRSVTIDMQAFTPDGRAVGALHRQTAAFVQPASTTEGSYEFLTQLPLAPGRYEIRAAVHRGEDQTAGSVYANVDVPDFRKARLSVSGLFAEVDPPASTIDPDALASLVPVVPTTVRTFNRTDRVTMFFRAYEGGTDPIAPVAMGVRIVNDHDVEVTSATGTIDAARFNVKTRSADHRFVIPTANLAPGEYLLEFDFTLGKTTAARALRFTIK